MKNIILLVIFLLAFTFNKGQNNLIPNPGFENAKPNKVPQCNYELNINNVPQDCHSQLDWESVFGNDNELTL